MVMEYGAWASSASTLRLICGVAGLLLTGCAELGGNQATVAPVAQAPMDPLAAFVATAPAGARGMVVLADGSRVPARVARSYTAANGRECREVMLGSGRGERGQLVCQGGPELGGAWVVARPLLGGSVRL